MNRLSHFYQTTERDTAISTPAVLCQDYLFLRKLGEGANSQTFLAVSRATQRLVAIKSLKFIDDFETLEMFKREAMALANIRVRGVPQFIGFVSSPNALNEYYMIQEYCGYPSLQQVIDKLKTEGKTLDEQTVLSIVMRVTNILVALHMNYSPPIIHRDIKPSNILYDEQSGQVMLIDFGAVANPGKRTENTIVVGTPGFMAPEQMMGECCVQSDFYALGVTAVCLLTGMAPDELEFDAANPFLIRCDAVLKEKNISQAAQALIRDMMSPQLKKRPANAMELKTRLRHVLSGNAPEHAHNALARRQDKAKHKMLLVCGLSILVVLAMGWCMFQLYSFMTQVGAGDMLIQAKWLLGAQAVMSIFVWLGVIFLGKVSIKYLLPKWLEERHPKKELSDTGCAENLLISAYAPVSRTYLPDCAECVFYHNGKYYYYYGNVCDGSKVEVRPGVMRTVKDVTRP